jgi:hypothetical protein
MQSEFPGRLRCVTKLKHYSMFRLLENNLGSPLLNIR